MRIAKKKMRNTQYDMRNTILRTLLFVVFFCIGTMAVAGSILCDDLLRYYRNKQLLRSAEETLNQLQSLNADYDALLRQLEEDPNLLERIAPATLGTEPADANTVYPNVTAEQLDAARKILAEDSKRQQPRAGMPDWLARCSEPSKRIILFLAGAFLILISFICFGPAKQRPRRQ
jgi:cell division protein FtsB